MAGSRSGGAGLAGGGRRALARSGAPAAAATGSGFRLRPTAALTALGLLAAVALGLALRRRYFVGVVGPDNFDYLQIANAVLRGTPLFDRGLLPFHVDRLAMTIPLALSLRLLGVSEASAAAWPTLCSLGSILVAFALGRRLGGPVAGL